MQAKPAMKQRIVKYYNANAFPNPSDTGDQRIVGLNEQNIIRNW